MRNADSKILEIKDGKVFFLSNPIPRADPKTFERLGGGWSRDAGHVYFDNQRCTKIDAQSFRRLNQGYGVDKNGAYYRMNVLADADPSTFQVLDSGILAPDFMTYFTGESGGGYARDAKQVWFCHLRVREASAASFTSFGNGFGRDATHAFQNEKRIVGADATSWRHWRDELSLDEKNVFFGTKAINGVDRTSVTLLRGRDSFMDRHGIICRGERTSLEDYLKELSRAREECDWEKDWLSDGRFLDRLMDMWPHNA